MTRLTVAGRLGTAVVLIAACGGGSVTIDAQVADATPVDATATDGMADAMLDAAISPFAQQAYIKASNTGMTDLFGYSAALSSDGLTLAIGAAYEDSGAAGIGGDQSDNSRPDAGAVYVFVRTGNTWTQQAYIKASNPDAQDLFGSFVSVSADGSTLAVSAPRESSVATGVNGNQADNSASRAGAVYVFTRSGAVWTQQAYVKASNTDAGDVFGANVVLSRDGTTLAVGASGERSNAISIDGNQTDNSLFNAGAAYVFVRTGNVWAQQAYIKASNTDANDEFSTVALSSDGSTMAVGAYNEASSATGINGNQLDNSIFRAGAVYVFTRVNTTWTQQAYLKASHNDVNQFGAHIAMSDDGSTLAVGMPLDRSASVGIDGDPANTSASPAAGAAYVFTRANSTWSRQAYIKASNTEAVDQFGMSVSLSSDGSTLAVGAVGEASAAIGVNGNQADNSAAYAGAVYMLRRAGSSWAQQTYVKASNTNAYDWFGFSVAVSGDGSTFAVGALEEASAATGIGGDQSNNSVPGAGAVYTFTTP